MDMEGVVLALGPCRKFNLRVREWGIEDDIPIDGLANTLLRTLLPIHFAWIQYSRMTTGW